MYIYVSKVLNTRQQNNLGFALGQIAVVSVQTDRVFSAVLKGLAFSFVAGWRLIQFQRFLGGNHSRLIAFDFFFFNIYFIYHTDSYP